ncbi:MAG: hypothetical protein VKP70_12120 [Cyanobacteriota bacterium]|nr:hypothetical protein [Cyanobacteriota bacterium]
MAKPTFHRKHKRLEPGIILLEAVVAAAFAATVLGVITPMFMRQIELVRNARDLDLIEAAVNKDISAMRHQARFFSLTSSPYSPSVFPNKHLGSSTTMIYNPGVNCEAWNNKGQLELSFSTDVSSYHKDIPGGIDLTPTTALTNDSVPGYRIARTITYPLNTAELQAAQALNNNQTTIRLRYSVRKRANISGGAQTGSTFVNMPFSFERTADIQVPAAFSC